MFHRSFFYVQYGLIFCIYAGGLVCCLHVYYGSENPEKQEENHDKKIRIWKEKKIFLCKMNKKQA